MNLILICSDGLRALGGGSRGPGAQIEQSPDKNVWAGVYNYEQARRGEVAYGASCAVCHLDSLKGSDMAPALVGNAFRNDWDTKSVRALYSRILSTMPADDPASLSEKTVLDIVAYLLEANGFPAGSNQLESADQAQQIRITRQK
jgi:mono/diheme cytochrome c family protein